MGAAVVPAIQIGFLTRVGPFPRGLQELPSIANVHQTKPNSHQEPNNEQKIMAPSWMMAAVVALFALLAQRSAHSFCLRVLMLPLRHNCSSTVSMAHFAVFGALANSQHLCICKPKLQCQHLRWACLQVRPVSWFSFPRKSFWYQTCMPGCTAGTFASQPLCMAVSYFIVSSAPLPQDSLLCCY